MKAKPRVRMRGGAWECHYRGRFWQFATWWQAFCCGLILASGQWPWMFRDHISEGDAQ